MEVLSENESFFMLRNFISGKFIRGYVNLFSPKGKRHAQQILCRYMLSIMEQVRLLHKPGMLPAKQRALFSERKERREAECF